METCWFSLEIFNAMKMTPQTMYTPTEGLSAKSTNYAAEYLSQCHVIIGYIITFFIIDAFTCWLRQIKLLCNAFG